MTELIMSHGVLVEKGVFRAGDFVKGFSTRVGPNSYFDGTWEELEQLVTENQHDFAPGTGSVDNDVILVNVPSDRFYSSVIAVTPENAHLVEERTEARQEGEKPVTSRVIRGVKPAAQFTQIVVYRADVLAQDNNRTTDAEWEIIAVLAQLDKVVPMHPHTMLRNTNHEQGGTYREYTQQEWDDAYAYWADHAYVEES